MRDISHDSVYEKIRTESSAEKETENIWQKVEAEVWNLEFGYLKEAVMDENGIQHIRIFHEASEEGLWETLE